VQNDSIMFPVDSYRFTSLLVRVIVRPSIVRVVTLGFFVTLQDLSFL